ncbi:resuscitation-promoting factor [Cellulosimicrobium cellulans]|uniref:Resuscitation-promoting factor n=1 Tax=Cellulosimicrobium cellulans TaxID=1710 RepID=A0A4Y4E3W7_CELCE|nr:resuscitation-promoting factor [Cellulosimicrobium cellulans]GED10714.1 resuscitation-promoting factor [Cellulosimicrobium cellulans]
MPGTPDDWTRVKNPFHRTADAAGAPESADTPLTPFETTTDGPAESPQSPAATAARRRRWPLVAGATAVVLLATGAVAYGNARKTVELDVDGKITTVTTFAGSVEGLLAEQDVAVGDRDLVVPDVDSALRGGGDVVVRYGREVPVQVDGSQSSVWLTALDADEALTTLATRGSDVRLVASRSGERASLPIRLDTDGPVNVVADGETKVAPDGSIGIDAILDQQGVQLGELDRVHVEKSDQIAAAQADAAAEAAPAADADATADATEDAEAAADAASVSLVVQRVKVEEVPTEKAVPFETVTEEDADRFKDLDPVVKQEGVEGVHTTVHRVTTVDGAEESRELVSEGVTTPPVNKILVQGTKERPKPQPKVETQQRSSSSSSSSSGGSSAPAANLGSAPGGVWGALAQCESGGNPATNTGNGYYGLYQFSLPTWRAMGGSGLPSEASAAEQTQRAQALQARSGWGQWPACAAKLGLL